MAKLTEEQTEHHGRIAVIACDCGRQFEAYTFAEAGRLLDQHLAQRFPIPSERRLCDRPMLSDIQVTIAEDERQTILLALAHLAVERPGWDDAIARIALKMDDRVDERPRLFDQLKELHAQTKP